MRSLIQARVRVWRSRERGERVGAEMEARMSEISASIGVETDGVVVVKKICTWVVQ